MLFFCMLALAHTSTFSEEGIFSLGYASRGDIRGLELVLGVRKTLGPWSLEFSPLSGIIYTDKNSRYREELSNGAAPVCRDTSNGQQVATEQCRPEVNYAALLSGDYALTESLAVGVGVRLARHSDPYATLRLHVSARGAIHLRAGGRYLSLNASTAF